MSERELVPVGEVVEGELIDAPIQPHLVDGAVIKNLCRELGLDPDRVTRLDINPHMVTVYYLSLRDGRPYKAERGTEVAHDVIGLPVRW